MSNVTISNSTKKNLSASQEEIYKYLASIHLQQGESQEARTLLKKCKKTLRNYFFVILSYMPADVIDYFMMNLRFVIKKIISSKNKTISS